MPLPSCACLFGLTIQLALEIIESRAEALRLTLSLDTPGGLLQQGLLAKQLAADFGITGKGPHRSPSEASSDTHQMLTCFHYRARAWMARGQK
jgi:hypothetical protein